MIPKSTARIPIYKTFLFAVAILTVAAIVGVVFSSTIIFPAYAQDEAEEDSERADVEEQQEQLSLPRLKDSTLSVELVADALDNPTSMDYINNDGDMIVVQKEGEAVLVSTNGEASQNDDPPVVINVPTKSDSERGLLGIAVADSISESTGTTKTFVFLYYTESGEGDSSIRNRIYRYEWDAKNMILTLPALILDLPAEPGPNHDGGKILVEKDDRGSTNPQHDNSLDHNHLYAVIGDLNREGTLQNFKNVNEDPDNTSAIFRLTFDGAAPRDNPFFNTNNTNNGDAVYDGRLSKYFAYGIRNSFGLAVDPLTGTLWMTENGPDRYDEINVVKPGFNSGWKQVIGPIEKSNGKTTADLVQLQGSHYADPVFSWLASIGVTDIEFLNSTKLGEKYYNNIFVGDVNNGNLYFFTINENRTGITFDENGVNVDDRNRLVDLVADNPDEVSMITFGTGFTGGITDIKTGPDGYLYVLSFDGKLYRIVHRSQ